MGSSRPGFRQVEGNILHGRTCVWGDHDTLDVEDVTLYAEATSAGRTRRLVQPGLSSGPGPGPPHPLLPPTKKRRRIALV